MLRVTLVPTKASASARDNVIPSVAQAVIDTRVPPGLDEAAVRERIAPVLAELPEQVEIEFTETASGNESPLETEFEGAIREWLSEADPEATLVPISLSDSHWFRKAFKSSVVFMASTRSAQLDLFTAPRSCTGPTSAAVSDVSSRRRANGSREFLDA